MSKEVELEGRGVADFVADHLLVGGVVGIQFGTVYALIADARNASACEEMYVTKGRCRDRPFGCQCDLDLVPWLFDPERVAPDLHGLMADAERLRQLFGAKSFLNFPLWPLLQGLVIPGYLLSYDEEGKPVVQVFSFVGDELAHRVEAAVLQRLEEVWGGPGLIAITSMNISERESILDPDEARTFCRSRGVSVLVHRSGLPATESYSATRIGPRGADMLRGGTGYDEIKVRLGLP